MFNPESLQTITKEIKDYYSRIDINNLKTKYQTTKQVVLQILSIARVAFVYTSNKMHLAIKKLVVLLRWLADQCERADQGLELLKAENQVFIPDQSTSEQVPVSIEPVDPKNLADIADTLMQHTNQELRSLTGTRAKQSKAKLVNDYLAMPI